MAQKIQGCAGRELGPEPCGGGDGPLQAWSLNHGFDDQARDRLCRARSADHDERIEGGRLFGHDPVNTKTGKAPAKGFEGRDRRTQAAPSRLGS